MHFAVAVVGDGFEAVADDTETVLHRNADVAAAAAADTVADVDVGNAADDGTAAVAAAAGVEIARTRAPSPGQTRCTRLDSRAGRCRRVPCRGTPEPRSRRP